MWRPSPAVYAWRFLMNSVCSCTSAATDVLRLAERTLRSRVRSMTCWCACRDGVDMITCMGGPRET